MFDKFEIFTTVFLGIFIEAAPFLLIGTLASGLVEVFVSREDMAKLVPRGLLPATIMGGVLGLAFPVCECGVVPLTRRLYRKGLPISAGIAFLMAAPIVNPVVIASTYAAYGFGKVLILRFVLGITIPVTIGLVMSLRATPPMILLPQSCYVPISGGAKAPAQAAKVVQPSIIGKLHQVATIATDEFFEMARYLIIGSMLAALMQTFISRNDILALGSGPVTSVIFMQVLAFVISVCSTVDAFISLGFSNEFTTGSILAFLVFGPMVDIKSTLMFLNVFRKNVVFYLVVLPFLLTMLVAIFINLNIGL
ncbi:MAG: permease [Anaerolineales bacterium]|nr:permease [Anaerolineales bacterium]